MQIVSTAADTAWIVERARALGFDLCGVVHPEKFPELGRTPEWLARGYAGEMKYLSDSRRADAEAVLPGVRSVIVCALNYNSANPRSNDAIPADASRERGWISRYAWGKDYHDVLREKLQALQGSLSGRFGPAFEARFYVDTGPINERVFAKYAGLGWLGKNTLLLNAQLGSWLLLGVMLTTLELSPSLASSELPPPDLCGTCTKCLDACPTGALVEPYLLDARRCISYLTIELRGSIAEHLREPMGRHVFGCDICQDVCPWNRRAPLTDAEEFKPRENPGESENESLYLPRLEWLASLSEPQFRELFSGSAIKRTKWRGMVRNACIALGNSATSPGTERYRRVTALLAKLSASPETVIAESAQWALSRIQ